MMNKMLLQWRSHTGRSQLIFLALLASLYLPIPVNSLLIIIFVVHSFFSANYISNLRSSPTSVFVVMIGFFAINALSLLYTAELHDGLNKLQTKLSFLLMPLAIAGSGIHRTPRFRKMVLNTFFWVSIIAALATMGNALLKVIDSGSFYRLVDDSGTTIKEYYFTYTQLAFFIMHPGYFSLYISTALFIGIHLYLTGNAWVKKGWLQMLLLLFLFVFLLLLQGRISIVAFMLLLFLGVMIYFFSRKSYWQGVTALAFPIVALAAVLVFAPPALTRRFVEFKTFDYQIDAPSVYDFNGLTIRLAEWHCAWDAIEEKPIAGYGLGDGTKILFESYRKNDFVVGLTRSYNAHNQYLETMLQTGVVGLIFLLAILGWFVWRAAVSKDLLLFMLTALFILSILTESMLERHSAISFFCSLLLYLGLSSKPGARTMSPNPRAGAAK